MNNVDDFLLAGILPSLDFFICFYFVFCLVLFYASTEILPHKQKNL